MLRQKQTITKNSGFTLIEAIVTIIIMLLLMGILLSGYSQAKQRFLVRDSAQQFADVIRQTIADTKNGIRVVPVAPITCVPDTSNPATADYRQCSNYKIRATSVDDAGVTFNKYDKYVIGTGVKYANDPMNHPLLVGTAFLGELNLDFTYSTGTFPLVSIGMTGNGGSVTSNETIQLTIISLSDGNIKTNICIMKSGSVLVQADPCN
ncbi:MAG: prepilin-type N-terminal cleavage/methylation domain-containing protein [bacterium]|nr:prepilin-type N-terminal cleavage/methylation domain-containing protein [bacterium]